MNTSVGISVLSLFQDHKVSFLKIFLCVNVPMHKMGTTVYLIGLVNILNELIFVNSLSLNLYIESTQTLSAVGTFPPFQLLQSFVL